MNNNDPIMRVADHSRHQQHIDEEVSLIDMWLIMVRHKLLILGITVIFTAIGVGVALIKSKVYNYSSSIEIGSRIVGDTISLIESPETVMAKLEKVYIPHVLSEYEKDHESDDSVPDITAQIPKGSQLIVLSGNSATGMESIYSDLYQKIISRLQQDHGRVFDLLRNDLNNQIGMLEGDIKQLGDQQQDVEAKILRLSDVEKLTRKEIEELGRLLAEAERSKASAMGEVRDASQGMTMLMIMDDMQSKRMRLSYLERESKFELVNERDELKISLADIDRQRREKVGQLENLKLQLTNIQETRMMAPPMRSLKPTGTQGIVIAVLAVVLGVMIGVLAAFFAEFVRKARTRGSEVLTSGVSS